MSLSIVKTGEVKIPRGSTLTGYSWAGIFPSSNMKNASFVFDWQEPKKIVKLLETWEQRGETLTLLITELAINTDVFIESFGYDYSGIGNCGYTLSLTTKRELVVLTSPAPVAIQTNGSANTETQTDPSKQYGKVTGSKVNFRKGPNSEKYKSYGVKRKGDIVEILGKEGNWYKIAYPEGVDGVAWIYASYVTLTTGTSDGVGKAKSSKRTKPKSQQTTTQSNASADSTTAKTLTTKKPSSSLVQAAKSAVKTFVSSARISGGGGGTFYEKQRE